MSAKEAQRADSVSMSEIENLNEFKSKRKLTKEEEIIHFINKFRFKNRNVLDKLINLINTKKNPENCSIHLDSLSRTIYYKKESYLTQLVSYINSHKLNNILQDFTFSPSLQDHFIQTYSKYIDNNNTLFQDQSQEFIQNFRDTYQAQRYYGYSIKNINLNDLESLLILIMVDEFILLNEKIAQDDNMRIESDEQGSEQLVLLNDDFNAVCIYLRPSKPSSQQQSNDGINNSKDQEPLYNIYILLLQTDVFDGLDNNKMRKTIDGKSVLFQKSTSQINKYMKTEKNIQENKKLIFFLLYLVIILYYLHMGGSLSTLQMRFDQAEVPQKYNKLIHRTTQIPRKSIEILVKQMDTDGDIKLTADDIKKFSLKNFISLDDEVYTNMFKEAASKRRVTHQSQYEKPISIDEILGAVTLHMRLNENKEWVQFERPFRQLWVKFLECVGEQVPVSHDLRPIQFGGIRDMHQLNVCTFKPLINKSKSQIIVKQLPPKQFTPPYRAEAGIIINNTENIREIVVQNENEQQQFKQKMEPFEKVVNSKFRENDDDQNPLVTFETQNYYKEAYRLSKKPELYAKSQKNPIYTYIPENMNFQMASKEPQLDTQQQLRKYASIKGSKAFSSNAFIGQDYESFSQLPGMEEQDLDELDLAVSLLKTQTIPQQTMFKNNQKIFYQTGFQNQQLGTKSMPVLERIQLREQQMLAKSKLMQEENLTKGKWERQGVFNTTFKHQDVRELKAKLAKQEPVTDNRFKVDDLENPFGMSVHDPRPKEALEREQKQQHKMKEESEKSKQIHKEWIKYFPKVDMQHNFSDGRRPNLFPKGTYEEPSNVIHNLLRGDATYDENFKLFHRPLRTIDRHLVLGENPESKF